MVSRRVINVKTVATAGTNTDRIMRELILASTSRYRKLLLERLELPFDVIAPDVEETAEPGEAPHALAARLAAEKAGSVKSPDAIVIGSDQVATVGGKVLRKPGTHDAALRQLAVCQGRMAVFDTAAVIVDNRHGRRWQTTDTTEVHFAELGEKVLDAYLRREQPYDCAGGFKAEGLGISLFSRIRSDDPTALLGLPLIWVATTLRQAGLDPLFNHHELL